MNANLDKYISVSTDGKTISVALPVPLGSPVYQVQAECENYCRLQGISQKEFSCRFPGGVCYTKPLEPKEVVLSLKNVAEILNGFGEVFFATKEEAAEKTQKLVEYNRAVLAVMDVRW